MIQSIYVIAGDSGDVLLEKHYRGIVGRAGVEAFWDEVSKRPKRDDVPPFLVSSKYYLCNIYREGVYLLALMTGEMQTLFVIEFLHRVFETYKGYFGEVSGRVLTENFSISYQLLEEMLDNGYPMITEPNALHTLIAPPNFANKMATMLTGKSQVSETIGEGAMSIIPWRRTGVVHVQNEIFFDIVEEIDCIVESNGNVIMNDVRGTVMCNSRMSGTPDLTLVFANPGIIEDCSFHPCVRYARFEREQVVSFVPPDGPFTLMTYRVVDRNPQAPLYCRPDVKYRDGMGRASFTIGSKPMAGRAPTKSSSGGISSAPTSGGPADLDIQDIKLSVTFPRTIKTVDMTSETGFINQDPKSNDLTWVVGRLPRDRAPELSGNLHLPPGVAAPLEAVSATLSFVCPNTTVSGLAVKDLILVNEKYKFFKGVKSVMKTGRFQIRT